MVGCYICTNNFSFFKKEYGCGMCGKSICWYCLATRDQTCSVASLRGYKCICKHCFKRSTATDTEDDNKIEPPKNLIKIQEKNIQNNQTREDNKHLEERLRDLKYNQNVQPDVSISKDISNEEIKRRIDNLQSKNDNIPSTEDMIRRLANLKGQSHKGQLIQDSNNITSVSKMSKYQESTSVEPPFSLDQLGEIDFQSSPKSQQEQINEIMKATIEEVRLDKNKDISECNDDELEFRIKKQILDERALEEKRGEKIEMELKEEGVNIQWCCICNEDADLICKECDDLYCKSCFSKGHKTREYKNHKAKEFKIHDNFH